MNNSNIKDKAVFGVGFLAALLAFSSLKEELLKIHITISGHQYSLFNIMIFFIILLSVSIYLYALDYLRYNFGKYQNHIIFRSIVPLANFFYSIAILFPVLVFLAWIIGSGPVYNFVKQHMGGVVIFDVVGILIATTAAAMNAYLFSKREKRELKETIESLRTKSLHRALELHENKFYGETLIEISKTLERYLQEKLFDENGFTSKYIPLRQLVEIASQKQIISKKNIALIMDLIALRNKAAHSSDPITKEQSEFGLNTVRVVFENEKV